MASQEEAFVIHCAVINCEFHIVEIIVGREIARERSDQAVGGSGKGCPLPRAGKILHLATQKQAL